MRLGVVSTALSGRSLDDGLSILRELGIDSLELACAGFFAERAPPNCLESILSSTPQVRQELLSKISDAGIHIVALAIHGEPLSPNPDTASEYDRQFRQACELAQSLDVDCLTLLAGLPEGSPGDSAPCWVANAFPPAYASVLEWQWEERLLPYWSDHATIASAHGVRLCFEMVAGDMVFNPPSLMRLREALGTVIGCNFDPSHLFFQGIDPLEAILVLDEAIYHVHAKDCEINNRVLRVRGAFDTQPFADVRNRSWSYRTVGYGHDDRFWRAMASQLQLIGYDSVVAIEHEDELMDFGEGLRKAVEVMQRALITRPASTRWWA